MKIRIPHDAPECADYLTRGKVYETINVDHASTGQPIGVDIIDDVGDLIHIHLLDNTSHLFGTAAVEVVE